MKFVISSTGLLSQIVVVRNVVSCRVILPEQMVYLPKSNETSGALNAYVDLNSLLSATIELLEESEERADSCHSRPIYRHRTKAELINAPDCPFVTLITRKRYDIIYFPKTPNGSLLQRRNRRERLLAALLREGGEIRQRYDAHSELYRYRHRRLEISVGQETVGNITRTGESQRALSLLSNLNLEHK